MTTTIPADSTRLPQFAIPVYFASGAPLPTTSTLLQASISGALSGNNTLISGVALQTIRVFRILYTLAGPATLQFRDGTTTPLTGVMTTSFGLWESTDNNPLFITTAGNGFVANLSAAVQLSGAIWYTQGVP